MPNRDYAARSKGKKSSNKLLILLIVILLLLLSSLGLWLLSSNSSQPVPVTTHTPAEQSQKSALPSRPEEIYSYIRDLETREVPVDKNSKLAKLTKEQEQQILQKQAEEKKRLEQQMQPTTEPVATDNAANATTTETTPELSEAELAAKKAQEKKEADEKRKQAELKKQQELAKQEQAKKADLDKKAEQDKQKAAQAAQTAKTPATTTAKPAVEAPKTVGKYGLQCGAFKNKAQAENMQARLAMAGYNAKISSNAEWNRVFVGPIGDRAAAVAAQSNARSVAECLVIGM